MRITTTFLTIVLSIVLCSQHTFGADWRGFNRSGHYNETNLLKSWPADGPKLLWETDSLGVGYGSPIISGNKLFIAGIKDSTAFLFAFDLKGKLLYKTEIGQEWVSHFPGSRSTPSVAGNNVYIMTGKGDFSCVDASTGKIIWHKNMVNDFGGLSPMFGFAEAPLIDGDKVYCTPGGKEFNVVALNRFTGNLIWNCKAFGEYSAYNSPLLFRFGNHKIIADFSTYHLLGIDAETGELLWNHEQTNIPLEKRAFGEGDTHANTALFDNNTLYYFAGDGNKAVALNLSPDGKSVTQIWNNKVIDNYMGGFVKEDSSIYSNGFSRHKFYKLNARTGDITDSLAIGRGQIIMADNMIYYYNDNGEVHLIDFSKGSLNNVSKFKITKGSKEHFAHPVIDNGVLYIRHGEFLGAYSISK